MILKCSSEVARGMLVSITFYCNYEKCEKIHNVRCNVIHKMLQFKGMENACQYGVSCAGSKQIVAGC
jgi:hypothetical protein